MNDYNQRTAGYFLLVLFFIAFICMAYILGATGGLDEGIHKTRVEAVRMNHAEWVVNEDGKTEFRWKTK